ncbi:MAG: carbonic anhydrase [Parvularculaceae bacterium]
MDKLAAGVVRFKNEVFPKKQALFKSLAERQSAEALFITCSDSRIDPNLLTQTDPGALFICRNAGNIVPPHTGHTGAMTASIEFAVGALRTPDIVVCGHTDCGAMKGAIDPDGLKNLPHVAEWLSYARAALLIVEERGAGFSDKDRLNMLIRENVILQMAHLRTHPFVAARLAAGKIRIHGWVYNIETGDVEAFDESARAFVPVAEYYGEEMGGAPA